MRSVYDEGKLTLAVFYSDLGKHIAHNRPGVHAVTRGTDDEIVLRTGYYSWSDGTIRDYPDV